MGCKNPSIISGPVPHGASASRANLPSHQQLPDDCVGDAPVAVLSDELFFMWERAIMCSAYSAENAVCCFAYEATAGHPNAGSELFSTTQQAQCSACRYLRNTVHLHFVDLSKIHRRVYLTQRMILCNQQVNPHDFCYISFSAN